MHRILSFVAALAMFALASLVTASPTLAVDNSISKLCRAEHAGSGYQRPGGFCDIIAAYHVTPTGDGNRICPTGFYNSAPGVCAPIPEPAV